MISRARGFFGGGLIGIIMAGCAGEGSMAPGAAVRDSAGVTIVENRAPAWREGEGWEVAAEPALEIGGSSGPPEAQLYRVVGATRLADGRIVIGNAGTSELRMYDAEGGHVQSIGGRGEGPGEFVRLTWLRPFGGDSMLAYDRGTDRLSVFDAAGRFVRSFGLSGAGAAGAEPALPLASGRVVAATRSLVAREALRTGLSHDSATILTFTMEGSLLDTVGRFPMPQTYLHVEGPRITIVPYPFALSMSVAPFGDGLATGWNDAWEVRIHAADGSVQRIVRKAHAARSATRDDLARARTEALAETRSDEERQRLERISLDLPIPERQPAYRGFQVDLEGGLWVEPFRLPGEEASARDVFDADGSWLGVVAMPPVLEVHEIGRDYVLGTWEDELGVERVRLYRLDRDGG